MFSRYHYIKLCFLLLNLAVFIVSLARVCCCWVNQFTSFLLTVSQTGSLCCEALIVSMINTNNNINNYCYYFNCDGLWVTYMVLTWLFLHLHNCYWLWCQTILLVGNLQVMYLLNNMWPSFGVPDRKWACYSLILEICSK